MTINQETPQVKEEVTLEDLATRMDMFGEQMNWLCENMASLFKFVAAMGESGGGIRGLMAAMKKSAPELSEHPSENESKVGA